MSNAALIANSGEARAGTRRRKRLRIGAIVALCLGVIGGYLFFVFRSGESHWQRVLRQLDHDDPGWRLDEIEASRRVVPPEQNSGDWNWNQKYVLVNSSTTYYSIGD